MARMLSRTLLFTWIAGTAGRELGERWDDIEATLAIPQFEFGIIAGGQKNPGLLRNFLLPGLNDFTVSVEEAKLAGAADFLVRPLFHATMMRSPETLRATLSFLENGYFVSAEAKQPLVYSTAIPENLSMPQPPDESSQPPSSLPTSGRLLGIDFGTVRMGIAICDENQSIASPLETYPRRGPTEDDRYFVTLVAEYSVVGFVVGLPLVWVDERYSTRFANDSLRFGKLSAGKRKDRLDKVAAQAILSTYLESGSFVGENRALDD